MSSIESFAFLANLLIVGGVGGYFIGYVLKKTIKVLLIGIAVIVFLLSLLAVFGTINVNYDGIAVAMTNLINPQQLSMLFQGVANFLPLLAGFAIGFILGIGKS